MQRLALAVLVLLAGCSHASADLPADAHPATPAAQPLPPPAADPQPATASRLVAVLNFRSKLSGAERASVDADYLANAVRADVLKTHAGMRVMTRENMLVLLQATGRNLEDCEGECEVDTGRRLGADLVLSGDLLRFGSSYKLDLRLHDTHSGELIAGADASGETADKLDRAVAPAVEELFAPLLPAGAAHAELQRSRSHLRPQPRRDPRLRWC